MIFFGSDGRKVCVSQCQLEDGRTVAASKFGSAELDNIIGRLLHQTHKLSLPNISIRTFSLTPQFYGRIISIIIRRRSIPVDHLRGWILRLRLRK